MKMRRPLLLFLVAASLAAVFGYTPVANAWISRVTTAGGSCTYVSNFYSIASDGTGGITNFSGSNFNGIVCSFTSIYSVSDLGTANYAEADITNAGGTGASSATACARSYYSTAHSCGTTATSTSGSWTGGLAMDRSAWTSGNGYYPYVSVNLSANSTLIGFYLQTN